MTEKMEESYYAKGNRSYKCRRRDRDKDSERKRKDV
jgi:hypothetical protein